MNRISRLSFLFSACFIVCDSFISAADNPADNKPKEGPELKVVNLAVYPAPITRPAMKYHLLPRVAEQKPGNAALLYDTIFIRIAEEDGIRDGLSRDLKNEKEKEKFSTNADKLSKWLETPLAELPKNEVRKTLDDVQPWIMEYAEMASRRMQCDWVLPVREAGNPFEIRLPELHRAKDLARILAMKARLSLAEGKTEDALKTLQIGFALSRQVDKGNVPLVNYLVGDAIAGMMRERLLDLTQLRDAPNLYWSLSNLPRPFLDFRDAVEGEHLGFGLYFSALQEAKKAEHSPEQWQKLLEETIDKLKYATAIIANKDPKAAKNEEVDVKKILEENYPIACDYLIKLGCPEKEIRSMAPARVLLLYGSEMWNEIFDDGTKWMGINFSQWPNELREHYNDMMNKYGNFPLADSFQIMGKIAAIQARSERDFDSLRTIEAIRLYAHSHDGKLPGSLDDIKEVPIPSNPMTGKPFSYHLDGDTAVLLADGDMQTNYEYHIKIAKLWIEKGHP
jgi:hypothetical protein